MLCCVVCPIKLTKGDKYCVFGDQGGPRVIKLWSGGRKRREKKRKEKNRKEKNWGPSGPQRERKTEKIFQRGEKMTTNQRGGKKKKKHQVREHYI